MTDMYIASCEKTGGIYHYRKDGDTFIEKQFYPADRPMYMEIKDNRLFAVLRDPGDRGEGGIVSFTLDNEGNLTDQSDFIYTKGVGVCHLAVTDAGIFAANYLSGSVFRTPDLLVTHKGKGVNPKRQEGAHTHCTVPTPDGRYICVADLGLDKIFVYDMHLNPVSFVKLPDGAGPRHVVFSEDGRFMYCITELSSQVFSFTYLNGRLEFEASIDALPKDFTGENTAAAIRISGEYLYISNRGHDSIIVFKLNGGEMTHLATVSCGGRGPRDFNICGDLLVCTNENSDNVTFYKLQNGIPKITDFELKIPHPLNVIFKE
ncbi:MAG: lactonase family protein [Acutalibacteraceae bacterium]|jgi:6-phosphogluconolactonase